MTSFAEEISATHHDLSTARRRVGDWMRSQQIESDMLIGDVEVVLCELAANVVDHSNSPWIRIAVGLRGDRVTIGVSSQGSANDVPPVEEWGELIEGTRGRGLRIVRAVCTTIMVTGDEEHTHVHCDVAVPDVPSSL